MPRKLSLLFSFLFHPLILPLAGIIVLLYSGTHISSTPPQYKKIIILLFVSGTLLLPLLTIPFFLFKKLISNIYMDERNDRLIPYSFAVIFYIFTYILLRRTPVCHYLHAYMLGCLMSVSVLFILNFKWKISAHTIGLGGITALVAVTSVYMKINMMPLLLICIAASGITATSRLLLSAHSPAEIYSGFIIGFLIMSCCLAFF